MVTIAGTQTVTYTIDAAHSLVEFAVKHMVVTTVKGRFTGVSGTINYNEADPSQSSAQVEIAADSILTHDAQRDGHLKSPDFFDVEKHQTITFTSTRVSGSADDLKVTGNLTIHGVTKEVTLDASFNGTGVNPWGATVAGFSAETSISRKDFGLNWNVALEAGGVLVGDKIKISLEIEAAKQA